ncbi:hypothetical protein OHC33_009915 [Knufia fluminis]|uniref:Ubiquitin-like domain-containing protein n=1 Tax=Knufia fluminis TaxID=191047 RepID=A0AAN8I2N0_9EURO|nr:hypothetical protein OHC33_009915 [Knufia fluminis]
MRQTSLQTGLMHSIKEDIRPVVDHSKQTQQNLAQLARHSSIATKALVSAQQALARTPVLDTNDSINFEDCLNRQFKLPFSFFDNWQTFESLLKNKFDQSQVPGGYHVATGSFIVTRAGNASQALTKSNWTSMVYPGCKLSMTVVFQILRLSLLKCPRPQCGNTPSSALDGGGFITCPRCGLSYRFDPNIEVPSAAKEEQRIEQQQHNEDVRLEADLDADNIDTLAQGYWEPPGEPQAETQDNIHEVSRIANTTTAPLLSAVDWHAGASGLEAWLAQSAMPMNEPPTPEQNDFQQEAEQRQRELRDLQSLQKVHFMALVPDTKPLVVSVPQYRKMPVESQIYLRKIADKFPALPMNLAERFAKSSVARKNRLKGLRTLGEREVPDPGLMVYDHDREPINDAKSAGTRRSRRDAPDAHVSGLIEAAKRRKTASQR